MESKWNGEGEGEVKGARKAGKESTLGSVKVGRRDRERSELVVVSSELVQKPPHPFLT